MLAAHRPVRARSLVLLAVALPLVGWLPAARADDGATSGDTVVGTVVRAYVEHQDPQDAGAHGDAAAPLTWIDPAHGDSVRVPSAALADVPTGAKVSVTLGDEVVDSASRADQLDPAQEVVAASVVAPAPATAPAAVVDTVTVALVAPAGTTPDSTTLDQAESVVTGPVRTFWAGQSRGAVDLQLAPASRRGWIGVAADCSAPYDLWNQAAAAVGFTPGPGRHLMLYVPSSAGACADGLAGIGGSLHAGGYGYVKSTSAAVIAHELGHNFGLLHSGSTECRGAIEGGTCSVSEYGDYYDVMGVSWSRIGSLNAVQSARLGFLPAAEVRDVTPDGAGGTWTLVPMSAASGLRTVRLTTGSATYYLEYRSATGQDGYLGDAPAARYYRQPGVMLRRVVTTGTANSSMLLDATPTAGTSYAADTDVPFPVGSTVLVADGFAVTVRSVAADQAVVTVSGSGPAEIDAAWNAAGGAGGRVGAATGGVACGLKAGGCFRTFANGSIYWSPATGAHFVASSVLGPWGTKGWENGTMGYPVTDTTCGLPDSGCFQHFQVGSVYSSAAGGAHVVWGAIRDWWAAHGWETGPAGFPTSDEGCGLRGGGCQQAFTGGTVVWSPATGAHVVASSVLGPWAAKGRENGTMGYPVTDTLCGLRDSGCFQHFQVGSVYSSAPGGVRVVWGAIRDWWATHGWETGAAGFPTGDETCGLAGGGCEQAFQGGTVYWSPASGAHVVTAAVAAGWWTKGYEGGPMGYPVTDTTCGLPGGGCSQRFQVGGVWWNPSYGSHVVWGAIGDHYDRLGADRGFLGYPTGEEYCGLAGGGCRQAFAGGVVAWSPSTPAAALDPAVQKAWVTEGEEGGRLGYPTGDSRKGTGDLSYAFFQGGQLTVSPGDQIWPFSYQVALN